MEFESYVLSHTSLDVYMLHGQVPETVIFGQTSDIGKLCEHGFYYWVMIRDEPIQYPDENLVLGSYFSPSIHVGPEMRAKIMKASK